MVVAMKRPAIGFLPYDLFDAQVVAQPDLRAFAENYVS
jgi:hypothetical protein